MRRIPGAPARAAAERRPRPRRRAPTAAPRRARCAAPARTWTSRRSPTSAAPAPRCSASGARTGARRRDVAAPRRRVRRAACATAACARPPSTSPASARRRVNTDNAAAADRHAAGDAAQRRRGPVRARSSTAASTRSWSRPRSIPALDERPAAFSRAWVDGRAARAAGLSRRRASPTTSARRPSPPIGSIAAAPCSPCEAGIDLPLFSSSYGAGAQAAEGLLAAARDGAARRARAARAGARACSRCARASRAERGGHRSSHAAATPTARLPGSIGSRCPPGVSVERDVGARGARARRRTRASARPTTVSSSIAVHERRPARRAGCGASGRPAPSARAPAAGVAAEQRARGAAGAREVADGGQREHALGAHARRRADGAPAGSSVAPGRPQRELAAGRVAEQRHAREVQRARRRASARWSIAAATSSKVCGQPPPSRAQAPVLDVVAPRSRAARGPGTAGA